jgi:hypothetical protein
VSGPRLVGLVALAAFALSFVVAGVAAGGDSGAGAASPRVAVQLTEVAGLPQLAKDPAVVRAERRARRIRLARAKRRAAARLAAARQASPAPAPAETTTPAAPVETTPPAQAPLSPATPAPAPPAPPPQTFDDSG